MQDYLFISVIVPVFNGEQTIAECIQSLLNIEYPDDRYEIIIVDNNSTDNTKKIVEKYPVKLLSETKRGSYAARNAGIRAAKGDIVAFTDSDCIVDKNWLYGIIKKLDDVEVGGVGGKVIAYNPVTIVERYLASISALDPEFAVKGEKPLIVTANAAYKLETLRKVGLFDDSFTSGGDWDMSWRVFQQGYKIVYEPDAIVYHKHRSDFKGLFFQEFKYGYGNVKLYKKHAEKNHFRFWSYIVMLHSLLLQLPWRIATVYLQKKKDKYLYIFTPICEFVRGLGYKLGLIYGSIKYRVIYL